ncbi:MAG: MBOAT family O-acyltransferase, partial [Planctomycetota bacterium]
MIFSSHLFLFAFLPLCVAAYALVPRRGRSAMLALLSYVFYGWAHPPWVILMLVSTVLDFTCGLVIVRRARLEAQGRNYPLLGKGTRRDRIQKLALASSVIGNLAVLGFFKYFDFTAESINHVAEAFGGDGALPLLYVALPVGISFYTFQTMSYTIDIYRGDGRALRNPLDFACYVAMFPQLVAGPIVRYHDVDRQLVERSHTWEKTARGCTLFACGFAKKVLLANPMGTIADAAFTADGLHTIDAWYGVVAYAFQIYFDFSGYSDMAIGLGLMFGFVFIKNFDSPYHADSITDLWRRWHISLSTWLRDYLYIPLGGNRGSTWRTYGNLATVMLLGGLWHGAAWTFVIWGAIHGAMLAFERAQGKDGAYRRLPRPLRITITFAVVCLAWIFFRAESLTQAGDYLASCL